MAKIISVEAEEFLGSAIEDIINSKGTQREKLRRLQAILDLPPHNSWVEAHPYIKNHFYIPIARVESVLKLIFIRYRVEVTTQSVMFNSVQVGVRVHYECPITGAALFQDGVGAKELQTKAGTGGVMPDFSNVNKSAVEMALPIAKSTAIKDACDHIGNLFGTNLMRGNTLHTEAEVKMTNGWQAFSVANFDEATVRSYVDLICSEARTTQELKRDVEDKIKPFLANKKVNFDLYKAVIMARYNEIKARETQAIPQTTDATRADIGELTNADLLRINAQNDYADN